MGYWEAVVLARKFLVLAATVFLASNTYGLQVAAAMWITAAATVLQLVFKPYYNKTEQLLEKLSLGSVAAACMVGQVIEQGGEAGLGTAGLNACRTFVGLLLVGTSLCFITYFVREVR